MIQFSGTQIVKPAKKSTRCLKKQPEKKAESEIIVADPETAEPTVSAESFEAQPDTRLEPQSLVADVAKVTQTVSSAGRRRIVIKNCVGE